MSSNNNPTPNSHQQKLGVNRSFKKHIPLPVHQLPLNHDHAISTNNANFNTDVAAAVCVNWPPLIPPPPVLDSKEEHEKMLRELTCSPSNARRSLMAPTAAMRGISQVLAQSDHLYPNQVSNIPSPPRFHILSLPSLTVPFNCTGEFHAAHHIPGPYSHPSMPPAAATTQCPWVMAPNATPYPHENSYFPTDTIPSHLINLLPSTPVRSSYVTNWECRHLSAADRQILEHYMSRHNGIAAAENTAVAPRLNSYLPAAPLTQQQQFSVLQIGGGSPPQEAPMLQSPVGAGQAIQAQPTSFPITSLLPGVPRLNSSPPAPHIKQQQQFSVLQIGGGSPPQGIPMLQYPVGAGQAIQAQPTSFPITSLLPGVPRLNSSSPAPHIQQQQQFSVLQIGGGSPPQGVPMLQYPVGAGHAIQAQPTSLPITSLLPGVPADPASPLPPTSHLQFVCPGSPISTTKPVSPTSSLESTNVRPCNYDSLHLSPEIECLLSADPPPALNLPFELLPTDRFGIQGLPHHPAEPCFIVNTDLDAFSYFTLYF